MRCAALHRKVEPILITCCRFLLRGGPQRPEAASFCRGFGLLVRDEEATLLIWSQMGTHISKVKSLSMDSWSNDQVEVWPDIPFSLASF